MLYAENNSSHIWDILCLQECNHVHRGGWQLAAPRSCGHEAGYGLRTVWSPRFQKMRAWQAVGHTCVAVAFDLVAGIRHLVLNVQLPTYSDAEIEFQNSIFEIEDVVSRAPRGRGRVLALVLAGDFNAHLCCDGVRVGEHIVRA